MSFSTKCHGAIDWEFSDSLPHFLRNIVAIIYAPVAPLRMDDCLSVVSADVLYAAVRPRRTNNRNSIA